MKYLSTILIIMGISTSLMASVGVKSCNSSQIETIRTIHRNVKQRVETITDSNTGVSLYNLNYIKNEYITPKGLVPSDKFKTHNNTYTKFHSKVKLVLNQVKAKMNGDYNYICDSGNSRHCRGDGGVTAYVLFLGSRPYNRVYFCPLFFQSTTYDQEDTVLHELTHLAGRTDHYFGTSFSDEGMVKSANDAYLYGRIMHMDFEALLRVSSWGLMWRRPRPNLVEFN